MLWFETEVETPDSELLTWLSDVLWFETDVEMPDCELLTWLSEVEIFETEVEMPDCELLTWLSEVEIFETEVETFVFTASAVKSESSSPCCTVRLLLIELRSELSVVVPVCVE